MKPKSLFSCLLLALVPSFAQLQSPLDATPRAAALRDQNLVRASIEGGLYATNLQDLVASSVVIVRGRWGALERRGIDYGLGVAMEEVMARTGASEETIHMYGLPYAHYEIVIDEILKGNEVLVDATVLTVGIGESPDALEIADWLPEFRDGEHLLFLSPSVGSNTWQIRGAMFDMKLIGDAYLYLSRESYGQASDPGIWLSAFGSDDRVEFIRTIKSMAAE